MPQAITQLNGSSAPERPARTWVLILPVALVVIFGLIIASVVFIKGSGSQNGNPTACAAHSGVFDLSDLALAPIDDLTTFLPGEGWFVTSPDGQHVAYAHKVGREVDSPWIVTRDGEAGKKYDDIWQLTYSPDSQTLAYAAQDGEDSFIVRGNQELTAYDAVHAPRFSTDGAQLAYKAQRGGKRFIVVNEIDGPAFDEVNAPAFDADGTVIYRAQQGATWSVVAGTQRSQAYDKIHEIVVSDTGDHMAFEAQDKARGWFYIVDGQELPVDGDRWPSPSSLSHFTFSPDGTQYAYVGNKSVYSTANGKKYEGYSDVLEVQWSEDGQTLAFLARKGRQEVLVFAESGQEIVPEPPGGFLNDYQARSFILSSDGQVVALHMVKPEAGEIGLESRSTILWGPREAATLTKTERHDSIIDMRLSPDGQCLAYLARDGKKLHWITREE